jgi:peptide/nickel transport system permease protein
MGAGQKENQPQADPRIRRARGLWKNPLSLLGLILLSSFALIALAAPYLAPPTTWEKRYWIHNDGFSQTPKPPNAEAWTTFPPDWRLHPLGTTEGQYDVYYGIIWGTRNAFRIGLFVVVVAVMIGGLLGMVAGYFGGLLDEVIMRIVDVFMVFPAIVWAIVLMVVLNHPLELFGLYLEVDRLTAIMIALITFWWLNYARLIRGNVLSAKETDYVLAARSLGAAHGRIMRKHVLPSTIMPLLVTASLDVGSVVLLVGALSFIGLGPGTGYADWGQLVSLSRQWITGAYGDPFAFWYTIVPPMLAILLFVLGWNLLGDAFRDLLDPRASRNK